jgi:O-antigen ligase
MTSDAFPPEGTKNKGNQGAGVVLGVWLAGVYLTSLISRLYLHGLGPMILLGVAVVWPLLFFAVSRCAFLPRLPSAGKLVALYAFVLFSGLSIFMSNAIWESMAYYCMTLVAMVLALQFNTNLEPAQFQTGFKMYAFLTVLALGAFSLYDYKSGTRLGLGKDVFNPNAIGIVAASVVLTAAAFRSAPLRYAVMLPACAIIVLTQSRASAVAALTGLGLIFLIRMKAAKTGMRVAVCVLFLCGLLAALLQADVLAKVVEGFFEIHSRYRGLGTGATGRFAVWAETWKLFLSSPIIGVGFRAHESAVLLQSSAHNGYLALLAEIGVFGFAGALFLILTGIVSLWRAAGTSRFNQSHSILTGLCCGYLIIALFERYLFNIGNPTSLLFLIGIMRPAFEDGISFRPEPPALIPGCQESQIP